MCISCIFKQLGSYNININVVVKDSDDINPHTKKPYVNRNVYVNKLLESTGSANTEEAEAVTF